MFRIVRRAFSQETVNLFEAAQSKQQERIKRLKEAAEKERQGSSSTLFNVALVSSIGIATYAYLGIDETQPDLPGETALQAHHRRVMSGLKSGYDYVFEPPLKKMLPDPLPAPYQRPFTLCVELNDTLVNLVWDKSVGWRVALRPGAKEFLANLSQLYEVVLFTNAPGHLAQPVADALDPYRFAQYRLFRQHTRLENNEYIKDISHLNRDPSQVILLDINSISFKDQPENGLLMPEWHGELQDNTLFKYECFLEELCILMTIMGSKDVRPFLKLVNKQPDNPIASWQEHKDKLRQEFSSQMQQKTNSNVVVESIQSVITTLFGRKEKKTINVIDVLESSAADHRALMKKELAAQQVQIEKMQKEHEEMIKKQLEENKQKKLKLWDYLSGAGQVSPQQ